MLSLIDSSNIVHSYGCVIVALRKGKLTGSAKYAQGLFITTNSHHLRSYLKRIAVSIHERNVQILTTEMYKVTSLSNEIFQVANEHPYNLRQKSQFFRPLVKSVYHGPESLSYLGPKVWDILPNIYKNIDGLHKSKKGY